MGVGRSIDETIDRNQHAYMKCKIVLFQKIPIALNLEKEYDPMICQRPSIPRNQIVIFLIHIFKKDGQRIHT